MFMIIMSNQQILLSQEIEYIGGKVINSASSDPVPFAAIRLKNHQLGVFANAEGDFKIMRNPEFQSDSLIITCIGYKRYSVSFKELASETVNKIRLTPAIYGLGEVTVEASRKKISSVRIIGRAIRYIRNNYPDKPFNYISYYRDYQKIGKNYINLNEAIILTKDNGFSKSEVLNEYHLLDFKKNNDFQRIIISPYYDSVYSDNSNKSIPQAQLGDQYGNEFFILLVHDAIRNYNKRSFSFINKFSEDFLLNHTFADPVPVYNNNLLLFKIDFKARQRVTGDSLITSGSIYIQPKDYSIHKLEYSTSYPAKDGEQKEMFNVDIEYGYENSVDSLMCLKYISFNNIFNIADTIDNTYFRITKSYQVKNSAGEDITIVLECSNKIETASARRKTNYTIKVGEEKVKIQNIEVKGEKIFIRLKKDVSHKPTDTFNVSVQNLKDMNGNILNKKKSIELYQYRELFVQEYNKSLPVRDSCLIKYIPLDQNCISVFPGKDKYWMNTPEKIKTDK
jgi:hypothetical protein